MAASAAGARSRTAARSPRNVLAATVPRLARSVFPHAATARSEVAQAALGAVAVADPSEVTVEAVPVAAASGAAAIAEAASEVAVGVAEASEAVTDKRKKRVINNKLEKESSPQGGGSFYV